MKKSIISFIGTAMLLSIAFGISNAKKFDNEIKPADASVGNYSTSANTYYSGITATSGKQLAAQLHDLITSTHQTYTKYL